MLTIEQIIQNYSDDNDIVIRISYPIQGDIVLTVLSKWGFYWESLLKSKTWQPSYFPYCLHIIYHSKTLRYGHEYDYPEPFYVADAKDFLQEYSQAEAVEG